MGNWCYLFIHDGQAELHDACHLVGLDTWEVDAKRAIAHELGVRPGSPRGNPGAAS